MDCDDECDNGYNEVNNAPHRDESALDKGSEGGLDPTDIVNPVIAFFFLSDDAQDEITGSSKTRMKCLDCGHTFVGEIYDRFPECLSLDTEEATKYPQHYQTHNIS